MFRTTINFIKKIFRKTTLLIIRKPDPSLYSATLGIGTIVPCQIEAYFLALNKYVKEGDKVLDVGCGLGYGLNILAIKARQVYGVDIDEKAIIYCKQTIEGRNPKLKELRLYDGQELEYSDNTFDIVTIVDVLEHVKDYEEFIIELLRVSKRGVFISTPNRRPEYTNPDGTPMNYWHLREWNLEELNKIIETFGEIDWNFLNGPFSGPFTISNQVSDSSLTLTPFIFKNIK